MTEKERAACYCRLIGVAQERMERGALMAFDWHHPRQRAACGRMLRYLALIRWLYARALRCDEATAGAFRDSLTGRLWPYGGIDDGDERYFRAIAGGQYQDVTGAYAWPA